MFHKEVLVLNSSQWTFLNMPNGHYIHDWEVMYIGTFLLMNVEWDAPIEYKGIIVLNGRSNRSSLTYRIGSVNGIPR